MQTVKTNAMRILEDNKIAYQVYTYESKDGHNSGVEVAGKINVPAERVYKTLVTQGKGGLHVFIIPAEAELDLKKAAVAAGEKKLDMLPVKELQSKTGYIKGGCSPVGMKKLYPTFIAAQAQHLEKIIVSAGKIGTQVELKPEELASCVSARFADVTH